MRPCLCLRLPGDLPGIHVIAGAMRSRAKQGQSLISECEPADGTNAAAENRDFGMSRPAARQLGYLSRLAGRKGDKAVKSMRRAGGRQEPFEPLMPPLPFALVGLDARL